MGKRQDNEWLTAAECASRTGLTARALRVYESYRLIVPQRTASGWRRYGPEELTRLNTITVLKTAGLTLAQIRDLIEEKEPSLEQVLRAQVEACKIREEAAKRGRATAEFALTRLQSHQPLSIDELCGLVRSLEVNEVNPILQKLRDKHLSAEEQQALAAQASEDRPHVDGLKAYYQEQRAEIFSALRKLVDAGEDASSPQVQQLIDRNNQLMTEHGVREWMLKKLQWNPQITRKSLEVGKELFLKAAVKPGDAQLAQLVPDPGLSMFFMVAIRKSVHRQAIDALLDEVRQCIDARAEPASAAAQSLAGRFKEICVRHFLGDPLVYARWAPFHRMTVGSQSTEQYNESWVFVARALTA